jgi:hypothetical protein
LFAYIPLLIRQAASVVQLLAVPAEQIDVNDLGSLSLAVFLDRTEVSKVFFYLQSQGCEAAGRLQFQSYTSKRNGSVSE